MNLVEYAIIDELYFVTSYKELVRNLNEIQDLPDQLALLLQKCWIKAMIKETDIEVLDFSEFDLNYMKYNYLATKAGLLAHNNSDE